MTILGDKRKSKRREHAERNGHPKTAASTGRRKPAGVEKQAVVENHTNPHRLARQWLADVGADRVGYYRGEFWLWDGKRWEAQPDDDVRATFTRIVKELLDAAFKGKTVPAVKPALIASVQGAVAGDCLIPGSTPLPSWRGGDPGPRDWIALQNGVLDVDAVVTLKPPGDWLSPHDPRWFSSVCLPYAFDEFAPCPLWMQFLERNLGDDPDKARLLRQWAGYLLTADTTYQRFLLMAGEGSNGKSVACAAVRAMLGDDNVCTVPLELFGDKFRLAGTVGKLANISAEVGEIDRMAEGQLKAFVSGDPLEFERKFKQPFTAKPTARLMLATNTTPRFSDKSDGIWRRVLLLPFTIQIPEAEQVRGMDRPAWWAAAGELPGILNWALAGLRELRELRRFVEPQSCKDAKENLRQESNPARQFLLEECRFELAAFSYKATVYNQYKTWCQNNGHHNLAENKFAAEVVRTYRGVEPAKSSPDADGKRAPIYRGLVLNPAEPPPF